MQMTDADANRRKNLGYFFDATVKRLPDKVAIVDLHGGRERTATYKQLDERMNRVASMLGRLGVKPGERYVGRNSFTLKAELGKSEAGHEH